jgi:hypothetical protein
MVKIVFEKNYLVILLSNKVFLYQEFFFLRARDNTFSFHEYYLLFSIGILQRFGLKKVFLRF